VGASTIACVFLLSSSLIFLSDSTMGSAKARVLPEPVRSRAIMSYFRPKMYLKQCCWIGNRDFMPFATRLSTVRWVIS